MHRGIEAAQALGKHFEQTLAIHVVLEDRLPPITTRRHVVQAITEFHAQGTGHVPRIDSLESGTA